MPTYLYECPNCQRQVELIQKISDSSNVTCGLPSCVGTNNEVVMVRIIQPSNFVLKGSCWARDGYKK